MRVVAPLLICALAILMIGGPASLAQVSGSNGGGALPSTCDIEFLGDLRWEAEGTAFFDGPVTILCGEERIQADQIRVRDQRFLEAEGNVLVVWQGSRIFGSRMTYDLQEGTGLFEDARGQALNDFIFWAKRAEKIGPKKIFLESATVTTCTQPTPYWSFSVSSATITLGNYARMWNVRLRGGKVPFVYLPYMIWPVKRDRAIGLLFPEFNSTRNRGDAVTQELFIPLGKSADVTLLGRYYQEAGLGGGIRANVLPNKNGQAFFDGFFIRDKVANNEGRYRATYQQTQEFRNGFKLFADLNFVSDFGYLTDFERDLDLVTSPTILAKIEFARNGAWTSLNVRQLRREQLFADQTSLVQKTLPEIEFRGRSKRLGKSPVYLSFESSLAAIQLEGNQQGQPIDADYLRADLFPTLTAPWSPTSWLDIIPRVDYRFTHYTQRRQTAEDAIGETRETLDDDISRNIWGAGLNVVGPKITRIFKPETGRQFKHTIEPQFSYGYRDDYDRGDEILLFDEVDRFSGAGEAVTYGIVQRLFAKRAQTRPTVNESRQKNLLEPTATKTQSLSDDPFDNYLPGGGEENAPEETGASEPVEIASLEFRQTRSFATDLSSADLDFDGVIEEFSPYSDINIVGRYNPTPRMSLDLRSTYDPLFDAFETMTISGGYRKSASRLNFSLVHRNGLGVVSSSGFDAMGNPTTLFTEREDDTTMRFTSGLTLFRGKLAIDLDTTYRFDRDPGQDPFPTRKWSLRYKTQCCTVYVEQLRTEFSDFEDRRDLYVRIDLTGIGQILKVSY